MSWPWFYSAYGQLVQEQAKDHSNLSTNYFSYYSNIKSHTSITMVPMPLSFWFPCPHHFDSYTFIILVPIAPSFVSDFPIILVHIFPLFGSHVPIFWFSHPYHFGSHTIHHLVSLPWSHVVPIAPIFWLAYPQVVCFPKPISSGWPSRSIVIITPYFG